jgi:3-oxoacyl-(acyl-carrier-protein) synthase
MHAASIPHSTLELPDLDILVKAGFGFGDVNACLVFKRYRA